MKTEVTNEIRSAILCAYYGCNASDFTNRSFKIDGEFINEFECLGTAHQLILKPLSEITDEDAIEVARLLQYHPQLADDWENIKDDFDAADVVRHADCVEILYTHICFVGSLKIFFDGILITLDEDGENKIYGTWGIESSVIDYLRSKGYDLGYGEIISLISHGIAVQK